MKAIFTYGLMRSELDVPLKDGRPPLYYAIPKPMEVNLSANMTPEEVVATHLIFRLDDYYEDKIAWYRFEEEK